MAICRVNIGSLRIFWAIAFVVVVGLKLVSGATAQTDTVIEEQGKTGQKVDAPSGNAIIGTGQGLQMQVTRIGLVDLDGVLRQSSGTAKVRRLLDEQRLTFQEEFTQREAKLQASEKVLQAERELLSEEAFNDRLKAFEDEVAEVQRQIQYRRQALDRAFQEAQRDLRGIALDIVKQIASERKLDFVLSQESALIFLPKLNISEEVLARLDERTRNARIEIKVGADE